MQLPGADDQQGTLTGLTGPDSGGAIWLDQDGAGATRLRCRVDHGCSVETFFDAQSETLEQALWAAVRALRKRGSSAEALALRARQHGQAAGAVRFQARADNARRYAVEIVARLRKREW